MRFSKTQEEWIKLKVAEQETSASEIIRQSVEATMRESRIRPCHVYVEWTADAIGFLFSTKNLAYKFHREMRSLRGITAGLDDRELRNQVEKALKMAHDQLLEHERLLALMGGLTFEEVQYLREKHDVWEGLAKNSNLTTWSRARAARLAKMLKILGMSSVKRK